MAAYARVVRELTIQGVESIGPEATAALLEFSAKALEQRARADGVWSEEHAQEYRLLHAQALATLARQRAGLRPS
jgi:hypothetical protein